RLAISGFEHLRVAFETLTMVVADMNNLLDVFLGGGGGLLLIGAVFRYVRPPIRNWWWNRRTRSSRPLHVIVLVDRNRRSLRRRSFWNGIMKTEPIRGTVRCRSLSVYDELRRNSNPGRILLDRGKTDAVVLNWDVINGDPVYGADRTQYFLDHYCIDLKAWLEQGGLLLMESQGAAW